MRRFVALLLALTALALAQAALAADESPGGEDIVGKATDVVGKAIDIVGKTVDLVFPPPLDLKFTVEDIGGKTEQLQVKETETEIRIELAADVLFDFDKSSIKPEAANALKNVAGIIRDHPGASVRIEGHTDGKGTDSYNQKLSEARARSVKDWLGNKEALKAAKFSTQGFGAKKPVAPNTKPNGADDPEGRQKNRRVEIVIKKG